MKSPFALVFLLSILGFVIRIGYCSRENRNSKYLKFDTVNDNLNVTSDLKVHQNALSIYQPSDINRNISTNPNVTKNHAVINIARQRPFTLSNSTSLVRIDKNYRAEKYPVARKHHHHEESHEEHEHEHEVHEHDHDGMYTGNKV